jgi:hypothetical protein
MIGKFFVERKVKLKHNVSDKTAWKRRGMNWIMAGNNCRLYDAEHIL